MAGPFPAFSETELLQAMSADFVALLHASDRQGRSIDELGAGLALNTVGLLGAQADDSTGDQLWLRLKHELYRLICTDDSRYAQVRLRLGKEAGVTGAMLLAALSSSLSSHLGIEAGLCTPFVALLLIAIARTSREVWCGCNELAEPGADMEHDHSKRLFSIKQRRLQELEAIDATLGPAHARPEISIEIESLRKELAELRRSLPRG